jgi:hypothetical protein
VGSRVANTNLTVEYAAYTKRNIIVHHNTAPTDVWAHFVVADFFIMVRETETRLLLLSKRKFISYVVVFLFVFLSYHITILSYYPTPPHTQAHSSFSAVAALLNTNCVIYDHFWHGKQARYVTLHNLKDKFKECYKPA